MPAAQCSNSAIRRTTARDRRAGRVHDGGTTGGPLGGQPIAVTGGAARRRPRLRLLVRRVSGNSNSRAATARAYPPRRRPTPPDPPSARRRRRSPRRGKTAREMARWEPPVPPPRPPPRPTASGLHVSHILATSQPLWRYISTALWWYYGTTERHYCRHYHYPPLFRFDGAACSTLTPTRTHTRTAPERRPPQTKHPPFLRPDQLPMVRL